MQPTAIADGLWRWTAPHPDWKPNAHEDSAADWPQQVGCVLVQSAGAAVLIDAMPTPDAAAFWRWADERCAGAEVFALTTIGFHRRAREAFVERYGASTSRARESLPGGVESFPIRGAGETIFWLPEQRALVPGDRLLGTPGGGLRVCPQAWLDYLPSRLTVARLRELLLPLLELPVERVLVSHGEPVLADARRALAAALA